MKRRIEKSDHVPPEMATFALDILTELPDGNRLCHGDFHPGNIIKTEDRNVIIDWSDVSVGDPVADYARTQLLIRLGEPPPAAPFLVQKVSGIGRSALGLAIRRGYASKRAVDQALLRRWEAPVIANRLAGHIEEERPKLLKLAEERLRERN